MNKQLLQFIYCTILVVFLYVLFYALFLLNDSMHTRQHQQGRFRCLGEQLSGYKPLIIAQHFPEYSKNE